jgi:hypothetical protein
MADVKRVAQRLLTGDMLVTVVGRPQPGADGTSSPTAGAVGGTAAATGAAQH